MPRTISGRDWKVYREINPIALERFRHRILAEIRVESESPAKRLMKIIYASNG